MARLRVRIELNRGGVGVPLHKLVSVVQESQRFLQMLAQDVHIEHDRGEWLAFDLDHESLNFTAEYVGPVSADQVRAFFAAFDGVTSLRRATITQFTRIADAIDEDELIGFGLYTSEHETEPTEWRCLSRRDALRIADDIQVLLGVSGELEQETHLPAVIDKDRAARLFKDRHERQANLAEQSKLPDMVRELETNLGKRITRLEREVETHSEMIGDLRENSASVEDSIRSLLTSVEGFCGQATRQLERFSTPQLIAPARPSNSGRRRKVAIGAAVAVAGIVVFGLLLWPKTTPPKRESIAARIVETGQPAASSASTTPRAKVTVVRPTVKPPSKPVPATPRGGSGDGSGVMHIELEAREPAWVSITDAAGKPLLVGILQSNEIRTLDVTREAVLRTGNAGGLIVRLNGKEIGQLGPTGKVRDVQFQKNTFKIRRPSAG